MNINEVMSRAEAKLKTAGIRSARLDSLLLLEKVSGIKREWLLAHPERSVSKETKAKYDDLIKQRAQRVPMQHLTHKQEFWGLEFYVDARVLSPRPESEKIVEFALERQGQSLPTGQVGLPSVLDVGTGCGCLAVAMAKERPKWKVSAVDVSEDALKVAKLNVKKHAVEIVLAQSDLLQGGTLKHKKFDVITANLPYLKTKAALTDEAAKEPSVALFGGNDGLSLYRDFFKQVPDHIKPNGMIIIESDPWQQPELIRMAKTAGLELKDRDRFVLSFQHKK